MTGLLGEQASVNKPDASQVQAFLAKRDLTVDLVRIGAVLLVVLIHSLMVGISTGAGGFKISDPAQATSWFKYATWFGQIMPLFFVVGGFASWQGYQSLRRRGLGAREFLRVRVLRLVYPAAFWYLFMMTVMWGCVLFGVPRTIIEPLVGGIGMPLWFLAAYLICQALVPMMVRLHQVAPYRTIAALLLLCILVDVGRYTSGITEVGLFNLLFIWPLMQQLGFFYADGRVFKCPRWALAPIAVIAFTIVAALGYLAPYSLDMLDNLNPPTLPLVFIGIAHLALLLLGKPLLDKLMARRGPQTLVLFLGSRAMTIYLWHLLIVILVSALVLVIPSLPQAGTGAWWWSRIGTIALTYGIIMLISLPIARFERGPRKRHIGATPGLLASIIMAVCAIVPPFWAMEFKLDMGQLLWGSALLVLAVLLALGRKRASVQPTVPKVGHTSSSQPLA